jgi:hypothetical protein
MLAATHPGDRTWIARGVAGCIGGNNFDHAIFGFGAGQGITR